MKTLNTNYRVSISSDPSLIEAGQILLLRHPVHYTEVQTVSCSEDTPSEHQFSQPFTSLTTTSYSIISTIL